MGLLVGGVFEVEPGDLLVPHLYDWSFDGVDDRVLASHSDSLYLSGDFTVMFWASLEEPYYIWRGVVDKGRNAVSDFWFLTTRELYGVGFGIGFTDDTFLERTFPLVNLREWHLYCGGVEGSMMFMSMDGESKVYYSFTKERKVGTLPIAIGCRSVASNFSAVRVAQLLVYGHALASDEVKWLYSNSVANATELRLLLDATFWDGSKFVDLSGNGNHGYPYGGVQRVPAEQRFVLHVKGRFSDGIPRLAVPGRCTYMFDCSWRENRGDSPVFVELQPGRRLVLVETLD